MSESKISFEELEATATQQTTAKSAETSAAETKAETKTAEVETKPQFTEADVEAYKSLTDMGITPQNAAEFKAAKEALNNLPQLLASPAGRRLLMDEIQKNSPETYKGMLEDISDRWFNELPPDVREGKSGNGSESRTASSTPAYNLQMEALTRQVAELVNERQQEKTAAQQRAIQSGLSTAFDSLDAKLKEKGVSDRDREFVRLKAEKLLWSDKAASERVMKGVYVDVPTFFSKASSLVTAETKAAATAEQDLRAGVETRASKEIPNAAENVNGASTKQEGHGHDPIWGNISSEELKSAYK
jgi:hypothetical protein